MELGVGIYKPKQPYCRISARIGRMVNIDPQSYLGSWESDIICRGSNRLNPRQIQPCSLLIQVIDAIEFNVMKQALI